MSFEVLLLYHVLVVGTARALGNFTYSLRAVASRCFYPEESAECVEAFSHDQRVAIKMQFIGTSASTHIPMTMLLLLSVIGVVDLIMVLISI